MAKFTLLELHLDGAQFTANAPGSGLPGVEVETDDTADDAPDSTGKPWLAALVGLLFLAAIALLARKKLGGDDEEYTDPEAAGFGD
ncbi:hypothetical protein [Halosegnis marinus]|uniref:Uncharacterized protein n=1 Tax=Halosegnis marinus TaxID=3034023 RepID=A0ABD5ZKS3_9EURY|nr:hypothetical protein [Halosegnis sp. DT85]